MAARLNGLCAGGSGAGPEAAETLAAMLNAGVHPVVPRHGSIGAADLCLLAHIGLVVGGEGEAELDGRRLTGAAGAARRRDRPGAPAAQGRPGAVQRLVGLGGVGALELVRGRRLLECAAIGGRALDGGVSGEPLTRSTRASWPRAPLRARSGRRPGCARGSPAAR